MGSSETIMKLVIYIDAKLMNPDPNTGLPQVGNLAFARKVAGVANVIFQSKTTADFTNRNEFNWGQAYKISASSTPPQPSTFVAAECLPQPISAGFMCDWRPDPTKPPLQFMPAQQPGDAGFLQQYPANQGMFGTKNQPAKWYNQVWCSTSGSGFNCIYTDTTTYPGLTYRGYQVQNTYQVSWEASNYAPGIFAASWTAPYTFNIPPNKDPLQNVKFLSWGYPIIGDVPTWFDYGTIDPLNHDPSRAFPSSLVSASVPSFGAAPPFAPVSVGFRLDWTGSSYSAKLREEYANAVYQYLSQSTKGWLNINNVYVGTYISGQASLRHDTSVGDYLPGETQPEKIRSFLRAVAACISPRFAPTLTDWNYSRGSAYDLSTTSLVGVPAFFRLVWSKLVGSIVSLATASLNYLKPRIQAAVEGQFAGVTIEYESVNKVGADSASVKIKVSNCPTDQVPQLFALIDGVATQERNNPQAILPDPVRAQNDIPASGIFDETAPESRMIEASPSAPSEQYLPGQEAEYQQPSTAANYATNSYPQGQNFNPYQGQGQTPMPGFGGQALTYRPAAQVGA
ncbi:MAG: hypothetical protein GOMPHAMPRED_000529 [Gomphillus americanus]|uniref:Uncharacterized protein n=1 Tax=Gomphillus americanus TaxID=1940652 RepID=A0A8H3EGV8_9LECA|nr:MAG: hypothetical protein GOMPHAMPRED_000529 [Gomphillus americanus]